jgi:hypothetical protein
VCISFLGVFIFSFFFLPIFMLIIWLN